MNLVHEVLSHVGDNLREVEEGLRKALQDASPQARKVVMHLAESGGKRVRPMLAIMSAQLFDGVGRSATPVGIAAELIHMATLVHDDVIDHASVRRGRKTVNHIWGNHVSVLAGDALLAKALVLLVDETDLSVVRIMSEMVYRMCEGEIAQHATLFDTEQDEAMYFDRIEKKTALFFAACCESGALMGGATPEQSRALWTYGRHLGMAFQVIDDLLDVSAEAQVVGKPVGHDLASGVLTLPVLHAIHRLGRRGEAAALINKGTAMTRVDVDRVIEFVKDSGAIEYAFEVAKAFSEEAKAALKELPANETRQLLYAIADSTITREF